MKPTLSLPASLITVALATQGCAEHQDVNPTNFPVQAFIQKNKAGIEAAISAAEKRENQERIIESTRLSAITKPTTDGDKYKQWKDFKTLCIDGQTGKESTSCTIPAGVVSQIIGSSEKEIIFAATINPETTGQSAEKPTLYFQIDKKTMTRSTDCRTDATSYNYPYFCRIPNGK